MKTQKKKKADEIEVTLPFDEALELFEKNMEIVCQTPKKKVMQSIKDEKAKHKSSKKS